MRDSLFFENGSGACVRVVDREKWSVRALRRIDPRTRLFFLDVLGYIAATRNPFLQLMCRQAPVGPARVTRGNHHAYCGQWRDVRPTQQWTAFVRQSRSRGDRERVANAGCMKHESGRPSVAKRGTRRPRGALAPCTTPRSTTW